MSTLWKQVSGMYWADFENHGEVLKRITFLKLINIQINIQIRKM